MYIFVLYRHSMKYSKHYIYQYILETEIKHDNCNGISSVF